jgi:uncharacterized protein YjbI with pentapeptide repeats
MNIEQQKNNTRQEINVGSESHKKKSNRWNRFKKNISGIIRFFAKSVLITLVTVIFTVTIGNYFSNQIEREKSITEYLTSMSELINDHKLYPPEPKKEEDLKEHNQTKSLARGLTMNVLDHLTNLDTVNYLGPLSLFSDRIAKGRVIKFLYESQLIGSCLLQEDDKCNSPIKAIISLKDANFNKIKINLSIKELPGVKLERAFLQDADLSNTDLRYTDFNNAHLEKANLSKSDLSHANLQQAYLQNANLSGSSLVETDLRNAQLCGVKLIGVDWQSPKFKNADFEGAVYDDTTEFGNIFNSDEGKKVKETMRKTNPNFRFDCNYQDR